MDYKNGKIYVIRSYKTDKIYVGATCSPLYKRFYKHKKDYTYWLKDTKKYMSSFEIIKYGDAYIELYEKYPCSCKNELRKKEGEVIRKTKNCINKCIAGRNKKQYCIDTKQNKKKYDKQYRITKRKERYEYNKKWYEKNKEKISQRRKELYHEKKLKKEWKKIFNEVLKNIK